MSVVCRWMLDFAQSALSDIITITRIKLVFHLTTEAVLAIQITSSIKEIAKNSAWMSVLI